MNAREKYVYIRLTRPEGYEDVASELVIADFVDGPDKQAFDYQDVTERASLLASVEESGDEMVQHLAENGDHAAAARIILQRQEIERINGIAYVMRELLGEWIATEIDPEDEEYETWMLNFTERAIAARNAYRAAYPKETP